VTLLNKFNAILLVAGLVWLSDTGSTVALAQGTRKPFTVADDIGMTLFWPVGLTPQEIQFSPDGTYVGIYTERGRVDLNRVEDSLRFYRSRDIEEFLDHSGSSQLPSPTWVMTCSDAEGPIINGWRWLPDSSGVAFLKGGGIFGDKRLVFADLRKKKIEPLTAPTATVNDFDIRDRQHYVYTVSVMDILQKLRADRQAASIVGTGRSFAELLLTPFLFSDDPRTRELLRTGEVPPPPNHLWAVVGGKPFEVKVNGAPVAPYGRVALSPDGQYLVMRKVVPDVPVSWETLYPPPDASSPYHITAGRQQQVWPEVTEYVRIHLQTGSMQSLTDAPQSLGAGWFSARLAKATWSNDGQAISLPGTFLQSEDHGPSRPCVAVVELESNTRSCVEMLAGSSETGVVREGDHFVKDVRFIDGDRHHLQVSFSTRAHRTGTAEYRSTASGVWQLVTEHQEESDLKHRHLEVTIEEALEQPPLLIGRKGETTRVILDPNPQLKEIDLGKAEVYKWKDKEGRDWTGGLYKPSNYTPGARYPLVIQTHGFLPSHFLPSGLYSTANAARELTAVGIVVLQVGDSNCSTEDLVEAACAVSAYEAAAKQLVTDGLVDVNKIGIIGFSQTCYYVMDMLTSGSVQVKAASVTDGPMADYWAFLSYGGTQAKMYTAEIGAPPFKAGLQQWLERSPTFKLDKVTTPLLILGEGIPRSLMEMWAPYAGLRYLQKPVDFIILNTNEHVLTNPAVRVASQGGTVDWFRFWLQDEEDPDPAKAEQYERWRALRKMQQGHAMSCARPELPRISPGPDSDT